MKKNFKSSSSIHYYTHISRLTHLNSIHYLEVPKEIINKLGGKLKLRLLCTINNTLNFQCGLVALGKGNAYISINSKRMKALGIKNGDKISVSLQKDESRYGMELPLELAEIFKQDDEGKDRFHALAPGKQRYIIHFVSSVKNSQLRIDRAITLIENLKRLPTGKESFRAILGMKNS